MNILTVALVIFGIFAGGASAGKVLGIFPFPGGSHFILATKLLGALAEDGHEITFIAPQPSKNIPKNSTWKEIVLDGLKEDFSEQMNKVNMYDDSKMGATEKLSLYQNVMKGWVNKTLHHPKMRALMAEKPKFDVVIMEEFFNFGHKYFAYYFDAPLILLATSGPSPWVANILRNPLPSSYVPTMMTAEKFNYREYLSRVQNFFCSIFFNILDYILIEPFQSKLLTQAFPNAPPISELNKKVALVLLNSHESLIQPLPLVPNMISVGGYHIDPPKALPKDLKQFLDDAKEGVVYFSLGSNLKAKDMSEEKKQIFFKVFGKLKQKVLWKFEDENVKDLPKNVFVMSWVPQQDVLAHPNVKLFITHGGLLSTTETIHHAVPVLAIPVFADQFSNAAKAVQGGYGLRIGYNDKNFTEETITRLINELLTNPTYSETVKHRSKIYHDRPLSPKENLVYWVNYVIRHKGAEHLKVAGVHLPLYQYLQLDILIPLVICINIGIYVSIRVLMYFCKLCSRSGQKKSKKQKTN